ncbi:hypothetical protein RB213_012888, partial [Colletotrichum asianum]
WVSQFSVVLITDHSSASCHNQQHERLPSDGSCLILQYRPPNTPVQGRPLFPCTYPLLSKTTTIVAKTTTTLAATTVKESM